MTQGLEISSGHTEFRGQEQVTQISVVMSKWRRVQRLVVSYAGFRDQ